MFLPTLSHTLTLLPLSLPPYVPLSLPSLSLSPSHVLHKVRIQLRSFFSNASWKISPPSHWSHLENCPHPPSQIRTANQVKIHLNSSHSEPNFQEVCKCNFSNTVKKLKLEKTVSICLPTTTTTITTTTTATTVELTEPSAAMATTITTMGANVVQTAPPAVSRLQAWTTMDPPPDSTARYPTRI